MEGCAEEPEPLSQSLFTGGIQKVEVCRRRALVRYIAPLARFCKRVRVCVGAPVTIWPGERPVVRVRGGCWSRLAF